MISSLRGTVLSAVGSTAVIEVGGVGFAVTVTPEFALGMRVGEEATVRTALIVREDDLSLFGFSDSDELAVFDLLRGVTGVGPKSAMGVLAAMTPSDIAAAIAREDDAAFRKVSGIGPKTAKLIVVSLAGKLSISAPTSAATRAAAAGISTPTRDVLTALVGLGWSERAAQEALDDVIAASPDERSMQILLRASLARLGPRQLSGSN